MIGPRKSNSDRQNYHQWLTSQYGLQRLVEHIWKLIGVARTCDTMDNPGYRMKELYGDRDTYQYRMQLSPPPSRPTVTASPPASPTALQPLS